MSRSATRGEILAPAKARILIVEDELLIRFMVSDDLREVGYSVVEACNADEAVSILKSAVPFDLVISDVRMPGTIDGLGLHSFVRSTSPALPFIMMSAHLDPRAAELDVATHFIAKPFTTDIILAAVNRRLEQQL